MGRVIQFEERAVATLRERLGEAESARADLAAFARGHSGAVAAIHHAVLAALEADSLNDLLGIVTGDWPEIMGLDSVVLALVVGDQAFRADHRGIEVMARPIVNRAMQSLGAVELRNVTRGHPLFGQAAGCVRAEALVALDGEAPYPRGLLLLGQGGAVAEGSDQGSHLLQFLGASRGAMLRRWASN